MNCDQARPLVHAFIDDELDPASIIEIEKHLRGCADCRRATESAKVIQDAVASSTNCFAAPAESRDRIIQTLRTQVASSSSLSVFNSKIFSSRHIGPLARTGIAALLVLTIGAIFLYSQARPSHGQIAELVDAHVRSLEVNHLLDVESTDQHTVKPWFAGKIEFSPPVIDLANDGFPLIGGRLEYLHQQKVAALIYRRDKHVINLFIWPGTHLSGVDTSQGFNLVGFECKGMNCWAVSDLNAAELLQFTNLFMRQKPASTRN